MTPVVGKVDESGVQVFVRGGLLFLEPCGKRVDESRLSIWVYVVRVDLEYFYEILRDTSSMTTRYISMWTSLADYSYGTKFCYSQRVWGTQR